MDEWMLRLIVGRSRVFFLKQALVIDFINKGTPSRAKS